MERSNIDTNKRRTSKQKITLIARNTLIPKTDNKIEAYPSSLNNSTTESIHKPKRLPSIKSSKKNNNPLLIATQIKQMKVNTQRRNSNASSTIQPKPKAKNIKVIKPKQSASTINNTNNDNNSNNNNTSTTKQQQISQWFHFKNTNHLYLFIPNSNYNNNTSSSSLYGAFTITPPLPLPEAFRIRMFKYANMPECITSSIDKAGVTLTKHIPKSNIIWKLISPNQIRELLRQLHCNQRFNHFPTTFHLGRKDNLYRFYKHFNNYFPNDYNYLPSTYLLPLDGERFQSDYHALKRKHKTKWIVKPANLSRGRGIHLLKGEKEFLKLMKMSQKQNANPYLISKYISNPHLINNKKYDLRIYVLITSFSPLKVFLHENGLVRFATEDYKKGDYDNIFIHLTNYSINKLNAKYKKNTNTNNNNNNNIQCCEDEYENNNNNNNNNSEIDDNSNCINNDENEDDGDPSSKWSLHEYKAYFIQHNKKEQFDNIWRGIKDIVIKTAITVKDNSMREIPSNKSHTLFELFGFDIIIDKKYRPWLIEVNTNPSLNCSSPLDLNIKTDLITDIINVIGVKPIHHQIQNVCYSLDGSYKTLLEICRAGGEVERDGKGKDHGVVRMEIMKRFNGDFKWKEMYNKECYKKMIEYNEEEEERMKVTGFERVFPSKDSVKKYMRFINGNEGLSDWDIVFWSYVVNKSKGEGKKEKEEVGEVVNVVMKDNNVSEDDNEDEEEGDEDNDSIDKYNDDAGDEGGQKEKQEKEMEMVE